MVKQRESGFVRIIKEPANTRIKNDQCPSCGKPKADWTRRTDWMCCSTDCTSKFESFCIIRSWEQLRYKVFERDNHTCVKCGKERKADYYGYISLVADHIIPIAVGGELWDIDNIQTLCVDCNKIKTKNDMADIAALRRKEKLEGRGQTFL